MAGLFGSAPKPPPVPRMPDQNSPDVQAANDLARRRLLASGGRDSTDLTGQGSGAAAGGAYTGTTLGSN